MSFLIWLLCIPYEADAKLLDSDKWQIRERAAYRLEKKLPWSLAVCFTKSKNQTAEMLKQRIQRENPLGRAIWRISQGKTELLLIEWIGDRHLEHEDDTGSYRIMVCHWLERDNFRVVIVPRKKMLSEGGAEVFVLDYPNAKLFFAE